MYKRILIATDGSPLSIRAVEHGVALAKSVGADVLALTVTERFHVFSLEADQLEDTPAEFRQHARERADKALSDAAAVAEATRVPFTKLHVEADQPYEMIIKTAQDNGCGLIVMASHGRRGVSALLLGSETVKVLTHSQIPVLVIRDSSEARKA